VCHQQTGWSQLSSCHGFVAVLLACLMTSSTVFCQSGLGDWRNVQNLAPETQIAVKTVSGEKYVGDLINGTADLLVISSDERSFPGRVRRRRRFRREEVREVRLWARTASLLVGGAIGGGIGAGIGGAIEASAKSNEDRGIALFVLTMLGFALGALIGRHSHIVKGKLVYLAPSGGPVPAGTPPPVGE
jgi:hypothetical protein